MKHAVNSKVCRRSVRAVLLLLLFAFSAAGFLADRIAQAAPPSSGPIWLLSSHEAGDYQQAADAFRQGMEAARPPSPKIVFIDVNNTPSLPDADKDLERPVLIVAVGSPAVRLARTAPADVPVLEILIPRLLFEELHGTAARDQRRSALFIDQPFARQLNLCKAIIPDLRRIAVLYGPTSQTAAGALEVAARHAGIAIVDHRLSAGSNPNAALDEVLDSSELLLALPDTEVFNRYTVAGLLLTAYHHDVPVIGFSRTYVNAGALAAVYSTPAQIGHDAAEMTLAARSAGWRLPAPRYPASFTVSVNRQVAQSLGLKLPEDEQLQQTLVRQEKTTP